MLWGYSVLQSRSHGNYAIGKFDKRRRFDAEQKICFDTELEVKANAGPQWMNYYYSSNLGQEDTTLNVVEGINSDTPTFHGRIRINLRCRLPYLMMRFWICLRLGS